ncbi:hypothetical protein NFI96_026640 [Prochilodus magdalenae]|nr:hypothetical protein NFI96_026640 [Prochilodus magdalenae]
MKLLTPVLLLLALSGCSSEVVKDFTKTCPQFFANPGRALSPPTVFPGPNYKQICQIRVNTYEYATLYDTANRIPVYSAYRFEGLKQCTRKSSWYIEPQLEGMSNDRRMGPESSVPSTQDQANDEDYDKSGYHRGHLAPVYQARSQTCSDATFTLTNAAPQNPSFNSGQWRVTEALVADILGKNCLGNSAYIVTGVVPGSGTLKNRVRVPSHFWTAYCCLGNNLQKITSGGFIGENKNDAVQNMTVTALEGKLKHLYGQAFLIFGGSLRICLHPQRWDLIEMCPADLIKLSTQTTLGQKLMAMTKDIWLQSTNAAPQDKSFNRGQWRVTEEDMADNLEKNCLPNSAYIVTGVVPGHRTYHQVSSHSLSPPQTSATLCAGHFQPGSRTTIVPVPKHSTASTLNDFRPVALTPIISKCFERLVSSHVKSCLPAALDLHQFAYRRNRSTEDAISAALHTVLSHLDRQNSYVRMLFIDFSSAFNTVIPSELISKLSQLGISTSLCNWILDFLTDRPQSVKLDKLFSSTITLNTGVPQGCVLSPLLYSLFTYDCVPAYGSNSIIKFADDTTVIGLIRGDDETAYRDEVQHLAAWCDDNNLVLNTQKTKEVIVDFRKSRNQAHTPIHISGAEVECVSNFKFLGVHISEDLTWSLNSSTMPRSLLLTCIMKLFTNTYEYATLYDTANRIPVYSAYRFEGLMHCDRKGIKWFIEPQLEDRLNGKEMVDEREMKTPILNQATDKDYKDSKGYHRGHLAPVYHATSQECTNATFTLTNAAPQVGASFNGGKWKIVEMDVAAFLEKNCLPELTFIVTGVVPDYHTPPLKNRVRIPSHFWTAFCCLDNNLNKMFSGGVIGENRVYKKEDPPKKLSVDEVEADLKNLYGQVFRIFGGNCN